MALSRMTVYLFAGDALTRGDYGESYVERIGKVLYTGRYGPKGEVANAGRDGDTVSALLGRIDRPLHRYLPHWVILAIGSNDVWLPWLTSHSLGWRLWVQYRSLRFGQSPTTDLDQFAAAYRALIDKSRQVGANVLACTISPLGEKLSSPVNRRAARLNGVIKHVAAEADVPVADVWQGFVEALAAQPSRSGYVPGEWLFAWSDRRRVQKTVPDEVAERRRLWLTFDGIHLNSRGAGLWAEIVLAALARAENTARASFLEPGWRQDLSCFDQGLLHVCCTPGWEVRARDLAQLQADAFESLAFRTGVQPRFRLAVLSQVDWNRSDCPRPYPVPTSVWDGESGTVFVPETYDDRFLREWHLPQMVAGRSGWPSDLAYLGQPARATAMADLLAIQELAHLFLNELRVAPADPALRRLLAAYLTQIVLHSLEDKGAAVEAGSMAGLWNAWGQLLADAGLEEGRVRLQARTLYAEHGDGLVASFTGRLGALEERVTASLAPSQPVS